MYHTSWVWVVSASGLPFLVEENILVSFGEA